MLKNKKNMTKKRKYWVNKQGKNISKNKKKVTGTNV